MLDELRAVPWPLALALFAGGAAVTAIMLILVFDGGGGSAATVKQRPSRHQARIGAGEAAATGRRPKREAESPPGELRQGRPTTAEMVGQRFMVGLWGVEPSQALLENARKGRIGGIVLFPKGASAGSARRAVSELQAAARKGNNRPLLIATDQEGGQVKRFPAGPPRVPLSSSSLSEDAALREGEMTGSYLRDVGINVDLAPVVDLGLPNSFMTAEGRTISAKPNRVAQIAGAFAGGLSQTGVMPVAKHFPGLGGASTSTDEEGISISEGVGRATVPYKRLIDGGIPFGVMLSTATYTQLDEEHGAAWSPKVVGLLRRQLGFRGLTISDDLSSPGALDSLSSVGEAVTDSAAAGVDVVMVAAEPDLFPQAYEALLRAAKEGRVPAGNLRSSYERIVAAKEELAR